MNRTPSPTGLPRRRFLIQAAATAGLAAQGFVIPKVWAADSQPTDWFHKAGWGVMTHYLGAPPSPDGGAELSAAAWNEQVDAFDVAGLVRQLASTGTKYLLFTVGQNSGHYCAPNATYDRLVGIQPSKCSRRDLITDLAQALQPHGIRLLAYLPSGAPAADHVARRKLQWRWGAPGGWQLPGEPVGGRLAEFQRNWEAIRACPGRWIEREGRRVQFQILSFLGQTWCGGERPQKRDDEIIGYVRDLTAKSGVITWDVPIGKGGLIPEPFVAQLRSTCRARAKRLASGFGCPGGFRLKNAKERFNGLLLHRSLAAWLVILPAFVQCCVGTAAEVRTEANVPVEVSFTAQRSHASLSNDVVLDVVFNEPDGTTRRVPAFGVGDSDWKVRYASATPGVHRWRSECVDQQDAGLHGLTGTVEVVPYVGDHPLFKHGPVRIAADRRHFMHADGTPFFWLGDTWWMGLTKRLEWPGDFHTLAVDRRAKGFNVVQIVAGLYPDMPAFDVRGGNEAGFPWETNYARLRPEYFNAADRRIAYLAEQGLVPCIVGAWGYHLPWLGVENMRRHWREIIARWGAWPVVWCAAGETTMPFYLSSTKAADAERQQREWTDIIRFIHATDPFGRLVTCHPSQTARASVTDPSVLDFDMQQTGHGLPAWKHALLARQGWEVKPVMPVISGEARYEALEIRPTLTAREAREAFWAHLISSGCAGHTYGANGIWQVNRRGQPYGPSPGGNNWGTTPWDDAMRLPGSAQLSRAKGFLAALPWSQFVPQPESAAWAEPEKAPSRGDLIGAPKGAARAGASGDDTSAPYTCGIGDRLRLVYVLEPRAVSVCALRSSARYRLTHFDPVTGQRAPTAPVTAGANGQLRVEPPPHGHDWVLLLEAE